MLSLVHQHASNAYCLFAVVFFLLTANTGEQPDQPSEAKQWAGEPNGQTDSDLPTGGGTSEH